MSERFERSTSVSGFMRGLEEDAARSGMETPPSPTTPLTTTERAPRPPWTGRLGQTPPGPTLQRSYSRTGADTFETRSQKRGNSGASSDSSQGPASASLGLMVELPAPAANYRRNTSQNSLLSDGTSAGSLDGSDGSIQNLRRSSVSLTEASVLPATAVQPGQLAAVLTELNARQMETQARLRQMEGMLAQLLPAGAATQDRPRPPSAPARGRPRSWSAPGSLAHSRAAGPAAAMSPPLRPQMPAPSSPRGASTSPPGAPANEGGETAGYRNHTRESTANTLTQANFADEDGARAPGNPSPPAGLPSPSASPPPTPVGRPTASAPHFAAAATAAAPGKFRQGAGALVTGAWVMWAQKQHARLCYDGQLRSIYERWGAAATNQSTAELAKSDQVWRWPLVLREQDDALLRGTLSGQFSRTLAAHEARIAFTTWSRLGAWLLNLASYGCAKPPAAGDTASYMGTAKAAFTGVLVGFAGAVGVVLAFGVGAVAYGNVWLLTWASILWRSSEDMEKIARTLPHVLLQIAQFNYQYALLQEIARCTTAVAFYHHSAALYQHNFEQQNFLAIKRASQRQHQLRLQNKLTSSDQDFQSYRSFLFSSADLRQQMLAAQENESADAQLWERPRPLLSAEYRLQYRDPVPENIPHESFVVHTAWEQNRLRRDARKKVEDYSELQNEKVPASFWHLPPKEEAKERATLAGMVENWAKDDHVDAQVNRALQEFREHLQGLASDTTEYVQKAIDTHMRMMQTWLSTTPL